MPPVEVKLTMVASQVSSFLFPEFLSEVQWAARAATGISGMMGVVYGNLVAVVIFGERVLWRPAPASRIPGLLTKGGTGRRACRKWRRTSLATRGLE